jgi:uncharacterized repeat protein (TIGR01451 family)
MDLYTLIRRTLVPIIFGLAASAAHAQVDLTNSVQKVVASVSATGEVTRELVAAETVVPGDELRYTISFTNNGSDAVDAGSVVITNPIPDNTEYLEGTAFGSGTEIVFSIDGGETFAVAEELSILEGDVQIPASAGDYTTIRWTFQPALEPGQTGDVTFNVRLK